MIDKYKEELIKYFKQIDSKAFEQEFTDFTLSCMADKEIVALIGLLEAIKLIAFKTYEDILEKN